MKSHLGNFRAGLPLTRAKLQEETAVVTAMGCKAQIQATVLIKIIHQQKVGRARHEQPSQAGGPARVLLERGGEATSGRVSKFFSSKD